MDAERRGDSSGREPDPRPSQDDPAVEPETGLGDARPHEPVGVPEPVGEDDATLPVVVSAPEETVQRLRGQLALVSRERNFLAERLAVAQKNECETRRAAAERAGAINRALERAEAAEFRANDALRAQRDHDSEHKQMLELLNSAEEHAAEAKQRERQAYASVRPLKEQVALLEGQLRARSDELQELEGRLREADEEATRRRVSLDALAQLEQDLERFKAERDEAVRARCDAENALATRASELADARAELETMRSASLPLTTQINDEAEREVKMARRLLASLEQECARANKRSAAFKADLEEERRASVLLRKRISLLLESRRAHAKRKPRSQVPGGFKAPARRSERPTAQVAIVT